MTDERNGQRRLGLLLLVIATFVHPEAALLLPAFVVGAWLLEGWRWFLHWDRIIELLLAVAGIGARYLLQHALSRGLIGGLETLTGSRPPLELAGDLLPRIQDVLPFFLDPQRLPWTILALVALVASGWAAIRGRRTGRDQAVLFFSTCLWLVPVIMVLFLGSTYQSPRYLNMLLPIFALLAACGLEWLVQNLAQLLPSGRWQLALGGLVTVALLAASWPGAVTASASSEKGFRSALEYVEEHWQSGDRVATVAPAYCEMVLEQCDAFILGKDYEEFVYRAGDGQWVDRWLGLPLLRTASELEDELDQGGRLWLVVDEGRLRKRFDTPFAQTVWQRMELVSNTNQAMVFLSRQGAEPAVFRLPLPEPAVLGDQVALAGYELGRATGQMADTSLGEVVAAPGQTLPLTLHWQAVGPVSGEYTVFVHLLGPDGQRYAQDDGPPLNGLQPMTHWVAGEVLPDRRVLDLPSDIAPGLYRLVIGLYEPDSGERLPITDAAGQPLGDALTLDYLRVASPGEDRVSPSTPVNADFVGNGDQIRLLGYDLPSGGNVDGDSFDLALYWQALSPVGSDYTVFVHLLDDQDQILGQGDGPPLGGHYPTSFWDPGQVVVGLHQVLIDAGAPPGTYRLAAGLYLLSTGDRLAVDGDDRLILTEVQVE